MIKNTDGLSKQSIEPEIKLICDYWHQSASSKSPTQVIIEFKSLFLQGRVENLEVSQALEKIVASASELQFSQIFSHCFYLILDCWVEVKGLTHTEELINILELANQASSYDRRRKQLIQSIKSYQQTKAYNRLRAVISLLSYKAIDNNNARAAMAQALSSGSQEANLIDINTYLPRYTFLYSFFAPLQTENLDRLNQYILDLQCDRQQNFEFQLSKHLIYRFRLKQVAKMKLMSKGAEKIITKANNPLLLSEKAFKIALQQYFGKVDSNKTVLERARRFVADCSSRNSYQAFKQDLQRFLLRNIQPRNSNYQFDRELAAKLDNIFVQSNDKPLNDTLILQTCRQLFSFLVIDISETENTHKFANLIVNLGTAQTMTILTKIVLICPESRSDLEKKIALIVAHHQLVPIHDVPWLFKSLEHLLMAFSIYFGSIDVPVAKSVDGY